MEDYNEVPFRQMVGAKIEKKDSERGAEAQMGFSLHGGKPIKELYRTVYTGGDDKGYCKDPIIDVHKTVTNDEGVSEKAMKSDRSDARNIDDANLKNAVRNPQPQNRYTSSKHAYGVDGDVEEDAYGVDGDVEEDEEDLEHSEKSKPELKQKTLDDYVHSEKSIRDMVSDRNITGFVKTTGTGIGRARYNAMEPVLSETLDAISGKKNDIDSKMADSPLMDTATIGALADAKDQMSGAEGVTIGDTGYEPAGDHVWEQYNRETPIETSDPTGHNGVGMGGARYDVIVNLLKRMSDTLVNNPKAFDNEKWDPLIDGAVNALKQTFGDTGDDGEPYEIDEETGAVLNAPTPNNPNQGKEINRQRTKHPSESDDE